jgi:N-carbamoylputrescine amidase
VKVKIALAQMACEWDAKTNLRKALGLMQKAKAKGAEIICFPELTFNIFFPAYRADAKYFDWAEPVPGPTAKLVAKRAKELKLTTLVNLFEKAGHGKYHDTSVAIDADGKILGAARMMHIAEEPYANEKYYYWPGDGGFPVFDAGLCRIGMATCYDRHFPEQMRLLTLNGAEIIFSPMAGITTDPFAMYRAEMQGCAFANGVFIALVNRAGKEENVEFTGESFVVAPSGQIISTAKRGEEELLLCDIDTDEIETERRKRPFLRDRRPEIYRGLSEK